MTKISRKTISEADQKLYTNNLWLALTLLLSKNEIRNFLTDLLSRTELIMLSKRLEISRRLLLNQNYKQIENMLHVSPDTILTVNKVLTERGLGYRQAHKNLLELEKKRQKQNEEHIKRLERKTRRKTNAETFIYDATKVLIKNAAEKIRKRSRRNSALV